MGLSRLPQVRDARPLGRLRCAESIPPPSGSLAGTTSREINRQIALNLVREKQPISRADLARLMGVRRGAISRLVNELLAREPGVRRRQGREQARPQAPPPLHRDAPALRARRRHQREPDLDAGDRPARPPALESQEFPTRQRPAAWSRTWRRSIARHPRRAPGVRRSAWASASWSRAWSTWSAGGSQYSPTLGWRDVDLAAPLRAAIELPVVVENSVKACVLAQVWAVRGDAPVDGPVAFVNVSDGVGVGIAIDGQAAARRPQHRRRVRPRAPRAWTARLLLRPEGLLGSVRLEARHHRALPRHRPLVARLGGAHRPDGRGHRGPGARRRGAALETLRETGYYLGRGLRDDREGLDPRRIYVGGEITDAWDLIVPSVAQAMREQALIREAGETEILIVPLGEHPRLRGAAALVSAPAFAAPVVA